MLRKLIITLPASKSISNRLLILQQTCKNVLQNGFSNHNLSTAEDTKLVNNLLNDISKRKDNHNKHVLNCENCGTAYRFLTAYLSCLSGKWILDGSERMRKRPIKPLVDTLIRAGADISYLGEAGFPPLQIHGTELTASHFEIDAQDSSQYVSAVAMILPLMRQTCSIAFSTNGNSMQYIDMTITLMQQLGLNICRIGNKITYLPPLLLLPNVEVFVEADWSSAAVWFAFAALSANTDLFIQGLKKSELQADSIIAKWSEQFGVQTNYLQNGVRITNSGHSPNVDTVRLDCRNNPDLVPYLASICVGLKQKAVLENVQNLSLKESNRIEALMQELGKIACIDYKNNALVIEPNHQQFPNSIYFSSHNDHRIAMCLSVLSACIRDVKIDNPHCVEKSYPDFWKHVAMFAKK